MRCAMCNRPLDKPAAMLGKLAIGPRCAKRAELLLPKRERAEVVRDDGTLDWVDQAQQGPKPGAGAVFLVGVVHG
jgi:hypothetical protein